MSCQATLHLFSKHLLLPGGYPNPVPSLARIHLPTPPLPSHFPTVAIYVFCAALHQLLLQVEPLADGTSSLESTAPLERWTLMQKTPGNGLGHASGEWFTASADLREIEDAREKMRLPDDKTLLQTLAATGGKFGYAQPVLVQATAPLGADDKGPVPTLAESLVRRASMKAQRWKELRASRRTHFDSNIHPVKSLAAPNRPFQPSFAPTYDSRMSSGLGYYSTLDLMHEHTRHREWTRRSTTVVDIANEGWTGVLEAEGKDAEVEKNADKDKETEGAEKAAANGEADKELDSVDAILDANVGRIEELQVWQDLRVRKGDASWISDRERAVADELFASLADLVESSDTPPAALLPESAKSSSSSKPGLAHTLARRLLSNRAPIIRGTLDPRRAHALHDNATLRLRTQAMATMGGTPTMGVNGLSPSPHAQHPKLPGTPGYMTSPHNALREPPPHTLPPGSRYYPQQQQQVQAAQQVAAQQVAAQQQAQRYAQQQQQQQQQQMLSSPGQMNQQRVLGLGMQGMQQAVPQQAVPQMQAYQLQQAAQQQLQAQAVAQQQAQQAAQQQLAQQAAAQQQLAQAQAAQMVQQQMAQQQQIAYQQQLQLQQRQQQAMAQQQAQAQQMGSPLPHQYRPPSGGGGISFSPQQQYQVQRAGLPPNAALGGMVPSSPQQVAYPPGMMPQQAAMQGYPMQGGQGVRMQGGPMQGGPMQGGPLQGGVGVPNMQGMSGMQQMYAGNMRVPGVPGMPGQMPMQHR